LLTVIEIILIGLRWLQDIAPRPDVKTNGGIDPGMGSFAGALPFNPVILNAGD
jgi:hypothetical protein